LPAPPHILEHMEADESTPETLPPWVMLEYTHILERTFRPSAPDSHSNPSASQSGRNKVYFTNLSQKAASALSAQLQQSVSSSSTTAPPRSSFAALSQSVDSLIAAGSLPPKPRICLLDPRAPKVLSPSDAQEFDAFLFGGILGDDPPRDRTSELRKLGFEGRHLDKVQMTTDTAVYVSSLVVDDGSRSEGRARSLLVGRADDALAPCQSLSTVSPTSTTQRSSSTSGRAWRCRSDTSRGQKTDFRRCRRV